VETVTIDLSDVRFEQSVPFETFAHLRENAPVWWWPEGSCWVVTTHDLVEQMNRDFETYSSSGGIVPPGSTLNPSVLLAMDPPEHTEYRRMVIKSFVPRAIAALEVEARAIAHEAVDAFARNGGGDFVPDIAAAIPFRVMAHLTGVPRSAELDIMNWGHAIAPNSDPEYRPHPTSMMDAQEALSAYLGEQFAERRANPGDDLFSNLLHVTRNGAALPEEDLRGFGVNYLLGGTETTRNLLGQALRVLLEHPAEMQRFIDGEVDTTVMVDELLRFTTPVLHHSRWVTRDAETGGHHFAAGDRVTLWMVSANRDAAAFVDPDRFDAGRTPNHHVSLGGGGPHFCLGSHLAKLEAVVTLEALRPLLGRMAFAGPPERVRSNFINGMKHLPIEVR
jgi:cholest-4-en-3-one 26-monooxygenase